MGRPEQGGYDVVPAWRMGGAFDFLGGLRGGPNLTCEGNSGGFGVVGCLVPFGGRCSVSRNWRFALFRPTCVRQRRLGASCRPEQGGHDAVPAWRMGEAFDFLGGLRGGPNLTCQGDSGGFGGCWLLGSFWRSLLGQPELALRSVPAYVCPPTAFGRVV